MILTRDSGVRSDIGVPLFREIWFLVDPLSLLPRNFYISLWFKYAYAYFTRQNRNVDSDPLTRTPINSMPITAFATLQLILLPIKKAVLPRRLVR